MKTICLLGLVAAVLRCAAQPQLMSGEKSILREMRGDAALLQMSFAGGSHFADRQSRVVDPNDEALTRTRNSGGSLTVSVAKLKHKIPKEALKSFRRGQELAEAGNNESAVQELAKTVALDPEFAEAHAALGVTYAHLMRFAEAEAELKRAIALDPSSPGYYNLGLVYFQTGNMHAAEASVRKALQLPYSEPSTHLLLAYILMPDPTKREEAEKHLRVAARTIPQAGYLLNKLQEGAPHS